MKNKKNAQWVTLPDDNIHLSASSSKKSSHQKKEAFPIKNKFFWGIGFVIIIAVALAFLAPNEFSTLIQGNLFDAPGTKMQKKEQKINPLGILPDKTKEDEGIIDGSDNQKNIIGSSQDKTVVKAETDAVNIQIEPIALDTIESKEEVELIDQAEDKIKEDVQGEISTIAEASDQTEKEFDANRKLLEELSKQISELKDKQGDTSGTLADKGQGQQNMILHGVANESSQALPSINSTATIGQSANNNSPYRPNVHRVVVSPQAILNQNLAQVQYAQQQNIPSTNTAYMPSGQQVNQNYYANLAQAQQGTPQSGPAEAMMVALLITLACLLSWKFIKSAINLKA